MIRLEAPGVEADRDIESERVGAGEIKVDEPRQRVVAKEHVVGKQIGMDHAVRQALRPGRIDRLELGVQLGGEPCLHLIGAALPGLGLGLKEAFLLLGVDRIERAAAPGRDRREAAALALPSRLSRAQTHAGR